MLVLYFDLVRKPSLLVSHFASSAIALFLASASEAGVGSGGAAPCASMIFFGS